MGHMTIFPVESIIIACFLKLLKTFIIPLVALSGFKFIIIQNKHHFVVLKVNIKNSLPFSTFICFLLDKSSYYKMWKI